MTADRRTGLVLFASCLAQFMVVLDVSIVNVALPSMRTALGFDAEGLAWVVNAYTLAFAGFLLLGGRAADLFGQGGFSPGQPIINASRIRGRISGVSHHARKLPPPRRRFNLTTKEP